MSKTEHDLDEVAVALDEESPHDDAASDSEDSDDSDDSEDSDASDASEDSDDSDDEYELPDIIMATEPEPDETVVATAVDYPDLANDVLEELRRADIDGPIVDPVPQDDPSSAIRRPRRSPDHDPSPFPIPMSMPRMLGRKPRVRRVSRVVRHVDPWSVFKIALIANLVLYLIVLVAGVLLWNVAYATGTVDNVERFFESFGWSSFEFDGGQIYHSGWIAGLFLVIGFTGLAVLMATLFNLITDLVGGIRFTVLEEEVVEARPSPMRRFVVRRAEPEIPVRTYDESGPIVREAIVDDTGGLQR